MHNLLKTLQKKLSKPILFGIYGAIGCLLAALLLGEPFLALTKLPPSVEIENQAIVLLIDTSSSMSGSKIEEIKIAAIQFVQRRDLTQDQLALVNFGYTIETIVPLIQDQNQLITGIKALKDDGNTPMGEGLELAISELQNTSLNKNILLFTDGQPNSTSNVLINAKNAQNQNINLIAVATGDADTKFLANVTGDSNLVFYASFWSI
jgi:Ca-activated chloride channel homolog